jgi:hypothetical protein
MASQEGLSATEFVNLQELRSFTNIRDFRQNTDSNQELEPLSWIENGPTLSHYLCVIESFFL